jgi:hypothetical protein
MRVLSSCLHHPFCLFRRHGVYIGFQPTHGVLELPSCITSTVREFGLAFRFCFCLSHILAEAYSGTIFTFGIVRRSWYIMRVNSDLPSLLVLMSLRTKPWRACVTNRILWFRRSRRKISTLCRFWSVGVSTETSCFGYIARRACYRASG